MRILTLFIFISCVWFSCTNDTTTQQAENQDVSTQKTKPKLPKEKIEAYTNAVKIVKSAINGEDSFEENGIKYDLKTVYLADQLVKLTTHYSTKDFEDDAIYYIRNSGLVMYDHKRTSIVKMEGELAEVVGTKVYLENNTIVDVLKKSKKAKPGGNLSLMDEYFTPIEVNRDSLKTELHKQLAFFKSNLKE